MSREYEQLEKIQARYMVFLKFKGSCPLNGRFTWEKNLSGMNTDSCDIQDGDCKMWERPVTITVNAISDYLSISWEDVNVNNRTAKVAMELLSHILNYNYIQFILIY